MQFHFENCRLDADALELWRDNVQVDVQPQVFAVIEYLVRERHRVVTKEELLDAIWGDRFVSESTLASRVKTARKALGDDGTAQRIIKTAHGRGYRFVAELADHPTPTPEPRADIPEAGQDATTPHAPPNFAPPPDDWPFVGRTDALDQVRALHAEGDAAGVVITGPERMGSTRFAIECLKTIAAEPSVGTPTWWVQGLPSTTDIPLSALAHLLPPDLAAASADPELARAERFRRALDAVDQARDGRRPTVIVDDVSLIDPMSAAVLGSLLTARHIFALITARHRCAQPTDATQQLVTHGLVRTVELEPLDEVDLDVLLYRALGAPVGEESLRTLRATCEGRPGLLHDVVHASVREGVFEERNGTYRLTGSPVSSNTATWPPAELSEAAQDVAARVALLGAAPISVVSHLADETGLDELDQAGMLCIGAGADPDLSLESPQLQAAVIKATGPLRSRRIRAELADHLLQLGAPWALARVAAWDEGHLATHDPQAIVGACLLALLTGDFLSAEVLAESLDPLAHPEAAVVLAEVAVLDNRWRRAEQLLETLDTHRLSDTLQSVAIRRRHTLAFNYRHRHQEALDSIEADMAGRSDAVATSLRARRLGFFAPSGRYHELVAEAETLAEVEGVPRVEILGSLAIAELGRGHIQRALELVDEAEALARELVPLPWRPEALDALHTTRCSAYLQAGRLDQALYIARDLLPPGQRSKLGMLPAMAAEIEMDVGRPRAAREMIRATVESSRRLEFPQYLGLAEVIMARVALQLGDHDAAAQGMAAAERALADAPGVVRWRITSSIAELQDGLQVDPDQTVALVLAMADQAAGVGADIAQADLLCTAAWADRSPATAQAIEERLTVLCASFEGDLWPIRVAHVQARAQAQAFDDIAAAYESLGHVRYAKRAAQGR